MSVKKILNNGNFIAHLAPVMAGKFSDNPEINAAANRLTTAADTYRSMLADLGITVRPRDDWEGCDQAKQLVAWITDPNADVTDAVTTIDAWTADIWTEIGNLAAGKYPK